MIGSIVGSYRITEKIGEGGMGAVFKGVDMMLEREVAIKMLRPELASQPQVVERFRTEAVTLAKLNHPNIATLYSFMRQGDDFFMVMEFVRGESLDDFIRRTGAMPCERAVMLFCQALEGMDHAHKLGIIHRDIKPANMMLTETGSIKVMDFGIARVLGTARMTKQGMVVGTIEYMSPEQVRGQESDARSDIYSLGILLYEMLTGRVPFHSESEFELMKAQIEEAPTPPRAFAAQIPLQVEQAIMRSLAKRPEARYQTVGEFRAVLLSALGASSGLDQRAAAYSAPATRVSEPFGSPAHTPEIAKETRLGTGPGVMAAGASSQMPETRLGQASGAHPAYAQQPQYYHTAPAQGPSLLSKLNWMHYAGAGVLLLLLIGVPLALIVGGSNDARPAEAQPQPAAQPASNSAAPASAAPASNPVVVESGPSSPSGAAPSDRAAGGGEGSAEAPRSSRSRSGATDSKTAGVNTPAATTQPPAAAPTPAPPAPRKEENVAKEPEKKEEKKEEKKKGGGLFGKIKGIITGDKKKDEKKP
jgi:serine/threonine-protein kinase